MSEKISECKTCGREIVWMKTRNDKNIPVDVPAEDDVRADRDNREEVLEASLFNRERMTTHFETCPDAKEHRHGRTSTGSSSSHNPEPYPDAGVNAKRLNTALAVLEDIAKNPPDGLRAQELAKTGLSQVRAIR